MLKDATLPLMKCMLLLLLITTSTLAQQVQVSKQNKTISVSADQTIKVAPDLAKLSIGRQDYAPVQDDAFRETKSAINRILNALQSLGIKDEQISTEQLVVEETFFESSVTPELRKQHKYHSQQSLDVVVPVSIAQTVVDACVGAGANSVGSPDWVLSDYDAAQAKAASAALQKARLNAQQMATGLGAKLGDLIYASNNVPNPYYALFGRGVTLNSMASTVSRVIKTEPQLKLFPKPIEVKATVYATFAIE